MIELNRVKDWISSHPKATKWIAGILIVIGLLMAFDEPLKNWMIGHLSNEARSSRIVKAHGGNFNYGDVHSVNGRDALRASMSKAPASIGRIAIPAVGLKLPIYNGLGTSGRNLLYGAGTLRPNQVMGKGNYTLAGHHLSNQNILFGPLMRTKVGQKVYLTDGKKVYTYKITKRRVIDEHQVQWIQDAPKAHKLTLFTCTTATPGETNRLVIVGMLTHVAKVNKQNGNLFQ